MNISTNFDANSEFFMLPFMGGVRLVAPENKGEDQQIKRVADVLAMPCNTYFLNAKSEIVNINEASAASGGFDSVTRALGASVFDLAIPYYDALRVINEDRAVLKSRKIVINELSVTGVHGEEMNYLTFKIPVFNDVHHVVGIAGCSIAIGHQPLAESLLNLSQSGLLAGCGSLQIDVGHQYKAIAGVHFTSRQKDIIYHLVRGRSASRIASILNLSRRTIEHHIENIKHILNAKSKSELIEILLN